MQWSDVQFNPSEKTLRQFAGLWLVCFGALALWEAAVRHRSNAALVLGVLALTAGPAGLVRPSLLRPVYVAWMVLAFPIGWTVSQLILAAIFFGLFTPIGLLFRVIGRDSLQRLRAPELESFWSVKPVPADHRRYFKQF